MPQFDLAIRGGTIVTAADVVRCDIGIADGRIASLARDISDARELIDASELLVMPGGIDSHVHLAQLAYGAQMADLKAAHARLSPAEIRPFCRFRSSRAVNRCVKASWTTTSSPTASVMSTTAFHKIPSRIASPSTNGPSMSRGQNRGRPLGG
jgi:cytosine/adenosine deaminase-related metal-dependent hydrolase